MTGQTSLPVRIVLGVALASMVACYEPTVVDCAVPCESPGDCAAGQICGSDGFCAAPQVAGTCADRPPEAIGGPDAGTVPTPGTPGTPETRALHLVVEGRGVVLSSVGAIECAGQQNHPGDCWFEVAEHAELTFVAASTHPHWRFDRWDVASCGSEPQCELSIDDDVLLAARFVRR